MSSDLQADRSQDRLKHVSPLRYPGGKAALADFLAETIRLNDLAGCSYFEPFAGGAGAALRLLVEGVVAELRLNDYDPRIFAFWKAMLDEPERFVEKVLSVDVNVEEWRKQSEICRQADVTDTFELGFATFYLNRCNRSGVITDAGPIGGYDQTGNWKIDSRFYRERLAARILTLAEMRDRIHVTGVDAKDFLVQYLPRGSGREEIFVYLDPPYYEEGGRLYLNSYEDKDHRDLSRYLRRQKSLKWMISYDDADFIRALYASCNISNNLLQYSLQNKRRAQELLITPRHVRIPEPAGTPELNPTREKGA